MGIFRKSFVGKKIWGLLGGGGGGDMVLAKGVTTLAITSQYWNHILMLIAHKHTPSTYLHSCCSQV